MTLSTAGFIAIWGTLLLAWLGLTYKYDGKWNQHVQDLGKEIRSYNAKNGYNQSIGREALARDLATPLFRNGNLSKFANRNDTTPRKYRSELKSNIRYPTVFGWILVIHLLGVVFTFGGISYFMSWGIFSPLDYLLINSFYLAISVIAYWIF